MKRTFVFFAALAASAYFTASIHPQNTQQSEFTDSDIPPEYEYIDETEINKKVSDWGFSVSPVSGFKYGTIGEYVFEKNKTGGRYKLSELQWDTKPEFFLGTDWMLRWKFLRLTSNVQFGLPAKSGTMSDSDWRNGANGDTDTKTNYSESDNKITTATDFNIKMLTDFPCSNLFTFSPYIGFEIDYTNMLATGGWGKYGNENSEKTGYDSWDSGNVTEHYWSDDEKVIEYNRMGYYVWTGCGVTFNVPVIPLHFYFCASTAPYVYMFSKDTHFLKNIYFIDITDGWFNLWQFEGRISYTFSKHWSAYIDASYIFSGIYKGADYYSTSSDGEYIPLSDESGTDVKNMQFKLGVTFIFF